MPKATFFNLNETKRERIIQAAINEFSLVEFKDAKVNTIVKEAGIAKGSFYQYFEDKFDLYKHVIDKAGEKKKVYFLDVFANMQTDNFFDLLSRMYKAGLRFASDYPKLAEIGMKLVRSSDKETFNKVYNDMANQVESFLGPLLQNAINKGEVRSNIDIGFVTYIFGQFNMVLADYYFNVKKEENIDDYLSSVDQMLDIFQNGVAQKK